jgi:DNA-binding GntR family transcriptional regulator
MKTDAVFKQAHNDALVYFAELPEGAPLPTEQALGERLRVSRTTVRKVIAALAGLGMVEGAGRARVVKAPPKRARMFPSSETESASAAIEKRFMEWMLRENVRPGTSINELEMSRRFGVATTGIREFLNRFQSYGLIEKKPNSGWLFKGFTPDFASELYAIREIFELRSALAFARLAKASPLWRKLRAIREEHVALLREIDARFHDFSDLDERFHRLVNDAAPNRFVDSFFDVISLVFHYHYQWNKRSERQRNEAAIGEHLEYIDALLSRRAARVEAKCRAHLASARTTLLDSTRRLDE